MPRLGKNADMLRGDGYVPAVEVAREIGRDLGAVHRDIETGAVPGRKVGFNWFVEIHKFCAVAPYPSDSAPMRALIRLAVSATAAKATAKRLEASAGRKP